MRNEDEVIKSFIASASGRVNLIGEHTDYNGGFVLPTAIPQVTRVELWPRSDSHIRAESTNFSGLRSIFEYDLGNETRLGDWPDYIQGVTHILQSEGTPLHGFEIKIESRVPIGSGLSSSAALEVSLLKVLRKAFDLSLDDIQISRLSQRVENEFVGAKVGIMDPMAASLARLGHALFLDTRDLSYRQIRIPLDQMDLLVIHSGVIHSNAHGGGYNERRSECEKACKLLGIYQLRDLSLSKLLEMKDRLPDTLFRRARHVITENARVLAAVKAIEQGEMNALGEIFYASHSSMRDDYEVSTPEIDLLIELTKEEVEVFGARLTGGGFGGSVVILTFPGKGRALGEKLCLLYENKTGKIPKILVPENSGHKCATILEKI